MIKKSQNQTGSSHIMIAVIILVAVIGALGYVVWSNFIKIKDDPIVTTKSVEATSEKSEPTKAKDLTYESEGYSFNYPADNWSTTVVQPYIEGDQESVSVRTSDYVQTSMDLDDGAEVGVAVFRKDDTLANMKKAVADFGNGTQPKDIKVSGVDAFSYNSAYEGMRYHTVFLHEGFAYDITYRHGSNEKAETYMIGYETIVSSFILK